ncbi:MAG: hypothetical protein FWH08_02050 [Oscillospiraceae bacterium]|nr:hypothetical protein [Oscillospiraceae bacterium]
MGVNSTQSIAENRERYAKYFEKKDKDSFSMDNFFTLLMAEMSNQDPMEPKSNTEFISQLANFTSLKSQQDALYYQNANYAQSLVGKTVTLASGKGSNFSVESGIVTSMSLSDGEFMVKVNGKNYALSHIMEVLPSTNPFAVTGSDGAYATSLIGKQVTVMTQNSTGTRITETGIVSHIEIANNDITVIIDGLAYSLASVVKVETVEEEKDDDYYSSESANAANGNSNNNSNTPKANETEKEKETEVTVTGTEGAETEAEPETETEITEKVNPGESDEELREMFED